MFEAIGLFQPTPAGERELRRRGLRVLVPIRAGYGASDPPPPRADLVELAVADLVETLDDAGIGRCPVVAPTHEIRTALTLAQRCPERVERIVALGAAFPTTNMQRFRRLSGSSRVFITLLR
ncbi:alpha/beta fold hydrolase, partial [Bradyrhizobium sp. NBAIM08]|uniref:alpha/beta fold hydrolase n=1 Tax=Bradyrhizobium sp. NBAIM08 TaxID=2793815 RepID=UPI0034D1AED9|nr:hypothetical protein [Bradyrhizobium sp. NBAIM08]